MRATIKNSYSENDRTTCLICYNIFQHLGSHIYHKHKIRAVKYKTMFGLPHTLALISEEVEQKKKNRYSEHREKYLANLKTPNALEYRIKKGNNIKTYYARREIERLTKRIKGYNEGRTWKNCPVCNIKYLHLESHLFNAHALIKFKGGAQ